MVEYTMEEVKKAWTKVHAALTKSEYDFRTVGGIASETELTPEVVQLALSSNQPLLRTAYFTDSKSNVLYTLQSRPIKTQERVANAISILTSTSSSSST